MLVQGKLTLHGGEEKCMVMWRGGKCKSTARSLCFGREMGKALIELGLHTLAGQLRPRQTKAKFSSGHGHRAFLGLRVFEGDVWSCSTPPLKQTLALSPWAAKFSHLVSFFSSDNHQDYPTKVCTLIVCFWRGVLELHIEIPSVFIHSCAEMSKVWAGDGNTVLLSFCFSSSPFWTAGALAALYSMCFLLGIPWKGLCNLSATARQQSIRNRYNIQGGLGTWCSLPTVQL